MKKVTSIFLALTILFSCFVTSGITALADDSIITGKGQGDFTWEVNLNTNTLTLSGTGKDEYYTGEDEVIEGVIRNIYFSALEDDDWAKIEQYKQNIHHIVYNEGITSADMRLNYHLPNLKTATFPSTLEFLKSSLKFCYQLEKVYIKSNDCRFLHTTAVIPMNFYDSQKPVIVANRKSTSYDFAKRVGRTFCDSKTNEITYFDGTNNAYMEILNSVKGFKKSEPATFNVSKFNSKTEEFLGYCPEVCHEPDKNNKYYVGIKKETESIIKGCTTDYQKAKAITTWIRDNIAYTGDLGFGNLATVYNTFYCRGGNCDGFAMLTEFMLHLADIPTVHITSIDHAWPAALLDGKWYMIQPTTSAISDDYNIFDQIVYIGFYMDDVCYVIDDTEGIKVTGVGTTALPSYRKKLKSVTIADFAVGAYPIAFEFCSKTFEVHVSEESQKYSGKPWSDVRTIYGNRKGIYDFKISSVATKQYTGKEICPKITVKNGNKVLRKGKDYIVSYKNNIKTGKAQIIVKGINSYCGTIKKTFKIELKAPKIKCYDSKNSFKVVHEKVKYATGYELKYKYKNKWITKKYKGNSKKITNLKKGRYKVIVRAYAIKNKEYSYSKWSDVSIFRIK